MAECSSYSSIFSFGDSMADTGNLFYSIQDPSLTCLVPPYGQTYFHHVSGRCSDGRLIIDFIAESLGIPMVKPYLGIKNGVLEDSAAKDGANFAVIGATALDELIDLGAHTLMVPGNFPIGCNVCFLTKYETTNKNQYDSFGCLKRLNEFAEFYNQNLQNEIQRLRGVYPHANIIYADYYNALLPLYNYPSKFGFLGLQTCCGMGGSYNYNVSEPCGKPGVISCDDPSRHRKRNVNPPKANLAEGDTIIVVVIAQANVVIDMNKCVVDSGATRHICANKDLFTSYTAVGDGEEQVYLGDSRTVAVSRKCKVMLKLTSRKTLPLSEVLHVPNIMTNLIYVALFEQGWG
ncbi:hypothetical protein KIW84_015323 [Lathyrus oleraceus]|uniref:Retrovirus-related Pol polyprotein from transposon TNT 1-94-like beta-barrel domain-containing protein n=1 Tax=Pisum sativum TaxID=3888 RepID=A0A9D5BQ01_PEA|nr:hypothetical protein KIW84_015323 [Pisum sativum]